MLFHFNKRIFSEIVFFTLIVSAFTSEAKTLHTELNGFQWYEDEYSRYIASGKRTTYRFFSKEGTNLFSWRAPDFVCYFCCSPDDPGRFVYYEYKRGGSSLKFYDSEGTYLYQINWFNGSVSNGCYRFKYNDSFYFLLKDSNHGSRHGLIDDNGKMVIPFSEKELDYKVNDLKLNGCLLIRQDFNQRGLISLEGKSIIPIAHGNSFLVDHGFLKVRNDADGICYAYLVDTNGDVLVKDSKSIEWKDNGFEVTMKNGNVGFLSEDKYWVISPEWGYTSFSNYKDSNGDNFYTVKDKTNLYGVIKADGDIVLPCEFEQLEYIGGNLYKFKSGDYWGVISDSRKVLIPTSRGYTSIGKYSTVQGTIPFEKSGYKGECNKLGQQIAIHKIANNPPISNQKDKTSELVCDQPFLKNGIKYKIESVSNSKESWAPTDLTLELSYEKNLGWNIIICKNGKLIAVHPINKFKKQSDYIYISWEYDTLKIAEIKRSNSYVIVSIFHNYNEADFESFKIRL